jgi:hypothetical protein
MKRIYHSKRISRNNITLKKKDIKNFIAKSSKTKDKVFTEKKTNDKIFDILESKNENTRFNPKMGGMMNSGVNPKMGGMMNSGVNSKINSGINPTKIRKAIFFASRFGGKFLSETFNGEMDVYKWECKYNHQFMSSIASIKNYKYFCKKCLKEEVRSIVGLNEIKSIIRRFSNFEIILENKFVQIYKTSNNTIIVHTFLPHFTNIMEKQTAKYLHYKKVIMINNNMNKKQIISMIKKISPKTKSEIIEYIFTKVLFPNEKFTVKGNYGYSDDEDIGWLIKNSEKRPIFELKENMSDNIIEIDTKNLEQKDIFKTVLTGLKPFRKIRNFEGLLEKGNRNIKNFINS